MKKLFYLIFIVALLGSCGGSEEPSGDNGGNVGVSEDVGTEEYAGVSGGNVGVIGAYEGDALKPLSKKRGFG